MNKHLKKPPRMAKWLLNWLVYYQDNFRIIGDLEESYYEICRENSYFKAYLWYWFHSLFLFPNYIVFSFNWSMVMFKNYLKIAIRNIRKQKVFSFINIAGLVIGMACCIIILLWAQDELSFDRFHKNSNELYRAIAKTPASNKTVHSTRTPNALGSALVA